jgi:hypothetical protein
MCFFGSPLCPSSGYLALVFSTRLSLLTKYGIYQQIMPTCSPQLLRIAVLFALTLAFAVQVTAQTDSCARRTILVSASDRDWAPIPGLQAGDFSGESHGKPVRILSVIPDEQPRRIVLLVDSSGSIGRDTSPRGTPGVWKLSLALAQKIAESNKEHSDLALILFNEKITEELDFAAGQARVVNRLREIASDTSYEKNNVKGRTALWDTVAEALKLLGPSNQSGVIYAITDGDDNVSKLTEKGIRQKIAQSDTRFFASLLPSPVGNRGRTPEELEGLELLPRFAADSGGVVFGPVMVNSSGNAFVLGVYPSSGVTVGDLVSNFYRTINHGYRMEIELPQVSGKWTSWKLEPSKALRSHIKEIRFGFMRDIPPCETASK